MSKNIGPLRFARWGEKGLPWHWRGWAVTWQSRKRIINIEVQHERRRP